MRRLLRVIGGKLGHQRTGVTIAMGAAVVSVAGASLTAGLVLLSSSGPGVHQAPPGRPVSPQKSSRSDMPSPRQSQARPAPSRRAHPAESRVMAPTPAAQQAASPGLQPSLPPQDIYAGPDPAAPPPPPSWMLHATYISTP
jgi:hypothetical protein